MQFIPTSLPDFPIKLKSPSASLFPGTASDDDRCGKEPEEEDPPPLGFKLTGYRLLNLAVIVGFGIFKAVCVYCGQPLTPTMLEIVGGALLILILYGLGLFEAKRLRKWPLFFHIDMAPAILRFSRILLRAISGCISPQVVSEFARIFLWKYLPFTVVSSFLQAFYRIITLELENLMIPGDQKMKQIHILGSGTSDFMWVMYGWGFMTLVWFLIGFLVMVALCVYRWLHTCCMRLRSRLLQSPIGNVA